VDRESLYEKVTDDMEKLTEAVKNQFKAHVQLAVVPS
jgi:hypothetical protein